MDVLDHHDLIDVALVMQEEFMTGNAQKHFHLCMDGLSTHDCDCVISKIDQASLLVL